MTGPVDIERWPWKIAKNRIRVLVTITGAPVPKGRPRLKWTKYGGVAYTPEKTRAAEEFIAWQIRAAHRELIPDDESAFGVRALFHCRTRERRDVDNLAKLVLDACTGIVWQDDRQVSELHCRVYRGVQIDKTELLIFVLDEIAIKILHCHICEKKFPWKSNRPTQKYCSLACSGLAQRKGRDQLCDHCGVPIYVNKQAIMGMGIQREGRQRRFYCSVECKHLGMTNEYTCENCQKPFRQAKSLRRKGKKFCSPVCRSNFWRVHRALAAYGTCNDCGGSTSKKVYTRCYSCELLHRRAV